MAKSSNWTTATTSVSVAMVGLVSCLQYGYDAWLEVQENGKQDHPLNIKNPALGNPHNWNFAYGVPRNEKELAEKKWFNDTEKDLTLNWGSTYAETQEHIDAYIADGTLTEGSIRGMGISYAVRRTDWEAYMRLTGQESRITGGYWVSFYQPKKGIPYHIPNPATPHVIVVCYDTDSKKEVNQVYALRKAGEVLHNIAHFVEMGDMTL